MFADHTAMKRRQLALVPQRNAVEREEVVHKHQQNRKTNPALLPPRRDATPSGTPTSINTRHAAGKREPVVHLDQ
jgi:hypothetical protein